MNFKIFVKNLNERILHIAKSEAERKGYILKKSIDMHETSILHLSCDELICVRQLTETLETGYQTTVLSVKDNEGCDIDFRNIIETAHIQLYNRDTLSIQREEYASSY